MSYQCPSCGAPLIFKSTVALYALCEYCHTQSLRSGEFLENLGRVSEVGEDYSPLMLGTTGSVENKSFAIIGRIQWRYGRGFWNEWYVIFDDGATAWIGEAQGSYTLTRPKVFNASYRLDHLAPGDSTSFEGVRFLLTNKDNLICHSGEGELPFKISEGYKTRTLDFRTENGAFITADINDTPPTFFYGRVYKFTDFNFQNICEYEGWPK